MVLPRNCPFLAMSSAPSAKGELYVSRIILVYEEFVGLVFVS